MDGERLFPIMYIGDYHSRQRVSDLRADGQCAVMVAIPWDMIAPHEARAQTNHGQSIKRLAERGGLSPCEAVAVLLDRDYREIKPGLPANRALFNIWRRWETQRRAAAAINEVQA